MTSLKPRLSGVDLAIVRMVAHGPCNGLGHLMAEVGIRRWSYAQERVDRLRSFGLLDVQLPVHRGRGYKMIIRKAR